MTARILPADRESIAQAAALILAGEVVAYPTETLYGLAVRARQPEALARLLLVKGRAEKDTFSLLVADERMLSTVVDHIPPAALPMISQHWPGPLTLVLPGARDLPPSLLGFGGGIGVRVSSDPVASALVRAVGEPITATSANRSGEPPANRAALAARLEGLALCLDGGDRSAPPSTVVAILDDSPKVLRVGAIVPSALRR